MIRTVSFNTLSVMKGYWFVFLLALPPPLLEAQSVARAFIINEIMFAPEESEFEFIELLNVSTDALDLCSFSFSDNRDIVTPICQETHPIQPGGYAVIARNGMLLSTQYPGQHFITPEVWPALNNSGDAVRLFRGTVLIDEVAYSNSWGVRGRSIERIDPNGPSWARFNWKSSVSAQFATPGQQNSVYRPDHTPPGIQFAEALDHSRVFVVFDEPVDTSLISVHQFRIQRTVPQEVHILSDTTAHLMFSTIPESNVLVSQGIEDYSGNKSTIRSAPLSHIPQPGDLLINELLYEPLADDYDVVSNQSEYVEIFNASTLNISLRHLVLTGPENEEGIADSTKSSALYPRLAPGDFALLYASEPSVSFDEAFPSMSTYSSAVTFLPISASSLGLVNTGDFVGLAVHQTTIDQVSYDPSWHYPDLVVTRGIALERRSTKAPATSFSNWSSSVHPEGGTPGYTNSITFVDNTPPATAEIVIEPTPFTPDGDGINDVLAIRIRPRSAPQSVRIRIYDSRGRLVRELVPAALVGQESVHFWNGTANDLDPLSSGIYVILIELNDLLGNEVRKIKKTAVLAQPW
ncbi:MAG: lamin tail domain-containing protein [Rhodothermaceae bacterium]|nr:lamin tail domain-containing protein [Rhodothermaceae bacterium]